MVLASMNFYGVKMLGKYLVFCGTILTVIEASSSVSDILDKFKQNDYQLKFEWSELVRYNKPEVVDLKLRTFKYNRTATVVNMTFSYNVEIGNDLEVLGQLYKFASNEFRLFPARMQFNFCDAQAKNVAGMQNFFKCGNFSGCPIRKGRKYHLCNWTPDGSQFPPFMPNGKYMLELQGLYHSKEMWVIQSQGTVSRFP